MSNAPDLPVLQRDQGEYRRRAHRQWEAGRGCGVEPLPAPSAQLALTVFS